MSNLMPLSLENVAGAKLEIDGIKDGSLYKTLQTLIENCPRTLEEYRSIKSYYPQHGFGTYTDQYRIPIAFMQLDAYEQQKYQQYLQIAAAKSSNPNDRAAIETIFSQLQSSEKPNTSSQP